MLNVVAVAEYVGLAHNIKWTLDTYVTSKRYVQLDIVRCIYLFF